MALIHLDAGVLIGLLDGNDAHHDAARRALADALDRGDQLAMASSALAECLVAPARRGDAAVETVLDLVRRVPIVVVPLDDRVALSAARLRARHRTLRLPDALVIAAAVENGAAQLITTDRGWPSTKALKLQMAVKRL